MKTLAKMLLVLLLALGCDSGDGEDESLGPDDPVDVTKKEEPTTVECTKHSVCEYGELCIAKSCQVPEGSPAATAYDFTRVDECPTSPTLQQEITLSEHHGQIVLLYFATTSCDACVADAREFESIMSQVEAKGFSPAYMITVILPMGGSAMAAFATGLKFPVVLDDGQVAIADHYKAGKDTVVLIDAAGYVRHFWPTLEVRGGAKDRSMLVETVMLMADELQKTK